MAINQTTNEVELEMTSRASIVRKYEALQRLKDNEDFRIVVLEGYLKEKAIDQVSLLGTDYVRKNNLRGILMEELVAISVFEEYMHMIENLGAPIEEDELEIDEE